MNTRRVWLLTVGGLILVVLAIDLLAACVGGREATLSYALTHEYYADLRGVWIGMVSGGLLVHWFSGEEQK